MKLILASTSPRRREILGLLGLPFEVIDPEFEEMVSEQVSMIDEVLDFAAGKARSVAKKHPESIVIGSDTMISLDGEKIGKPGDIDDARRILRLLAGKIHRIFTSVVILDSVGGPGLQIVETVSVEMRGYTEEEINRYLSLNESLDKAGAYSIQGQGRKLIASIRGDYLAAVGMPLRPIADYLKSRGMSFDLDIDKLYADKVVLNWHDFG
ncbi:MAG: septum formation protein Maf [Deltaproteobacteria bacterium]|nr:MAG: septum formation protein Maf [Deltaproteobacteria bacterium]